jgi:hypothetical protein
LDEGHEKKDECRGVEGREVRFVQKVTIADGAV